MAQSRQYDCGGSEDVSGVIWDTLVSETFAWGWQIGQSNVGNHALVGSS